MNTRVLLTSIAALFLATGAKAEPILADSTCKTKPSEVSLCNLIASTADSGDPAWPTRLTVINNSDRDVGNAEWICRRYPWDPRWPVEHDNPGISLESFKVPAHRTRWWNFRTGVPGDFHYCVWVHAGLE